MASKTATQSQEEAAAAAELFDNTEKYLSKIRKLFQEERERASKQAAALTVNRGLNSASSSSIFSHKFLGEGCKK